MPVIELVISDAFFRLPIFDTESFADTVNWLFSLINRSSNAELKVRIHTTINSNDKVALHVLKFVALFTHAAWC